MRRFFPPHIAWPLFICSFFVMSFTASGITVYSALKDGGPAPIEDYYQKAVDWDVLAAERAASDALGWSADYEIAEGATPSTYVVTVTVTDSLGAPMDGLTGHLRVQRPQDTQAIATVPLVGGEQGTYRATAPAATEGLYDLTTELKHPEKAKFIVSERHAL
jgi:nitrogen fixation protein FixH